MSSSRHCFSSAKLLTGGRRPLRRVLAPITQMGSSRWTLYEEGGSGPSGWAKRAVNSQRRFDTADSGQMQASDCLEQPSGSWSPNCGGQYHCRKSEGDTLGRQWINLLPLGYRHASIFVAGKREAGSIRRLSIYMDLVSSTVSSPKAWYRLCTTRSEHIVFVTQLLPAWYWQITILVFINPAANKKESIVIRCVALQEYWLLKTSPIKAMIS